MVFNLKSSRFLSVDKSVVLLIISFLSIVSIGNSQIDCGSSYDEYLEQCMADGIGASKSDCLDTQKSLDVELNIPVIFHVVHTGEEIGHKLNPSIEQIKFALDNVNNIFGKGLWDVDIGISFHLANSDENGNKSTGVNRIDGSQFPNYSKYGLLMEGSVLPAIDLYNGSQLKTTTQWNPLKYINIWVVNNVIKHTDQETTEPAGYATFPWQFEKSAKGDGIVIELGMGELTKRGVYNKRTLAHELGHYFGLLHTFQCKSFQDWKACSDVKDCPQNQNCKLQGDLVCDTPPHKEGECLSLSKCPPVAGLQSTFPKYKVEYSSKNAMSYCDIPSNYGFTPGQKKRIHCFLRQFPRSSFLVYSQDSSAITEEVLNTIDEFDILDFSSLNSDWDSIAEFSEGANISPQEPSLKDCDKFNFGNLGFRNTKNVELFVVLSKDSGASSPLAFFKIQPGDTKWQKELYHNTKYYHRVFETDPGRQTNKIIYNNTFVYRSWISLSGCENKLVDIEY